MSEWLNRVVDDGGEFCRNCSTDEPIWRQLYGREMERCYNCDDGAYDVYDFDEDDPY